MPRRLLLVMLGVGFCATALPGCGLLSPRVQVSDTHVPEERHVPAEVVEQNLTPPRRPDDAALADPPAGQRVPEFQEAAAPLQPLSPTDRSTSPLGQTVSQHQGISATPPNSPQVDSPPAKDEPLVSALHCLLNNQPKEALKHLEGFEGTTQELCMRLLGVLASLNDKRVEQLSPEEKDTLEKQLEGLGLALRSSSELAITKLCLCEQIDGYRLYKQLPENHVFRPPSTPQQQGEYVQVYVELRNITCKPHNNSFLTSVHGVIRVLDEQGKNVYEHNYDRLGKSQTEIRVANPDWFWRGDFWVPKGMPPGKYTLTVEIVDEMAQPHQRAHKSVEFVVGTPGGR
jgi:hypothetical protein